MTEFEVGTRGPHSDLFFQRSVLSRSEMGLADRWVFLNFLDFIFFVDQVGLVGFLGGRGD